MSVARSLSLVLLVLVCVFVVLVPWSVKAGACPTEVTSWSCPKNCNSLVGIPVPCGTGGLALAFVGAATGGAVAWRALKRRQP